MKISKQQEYILKDAIEFFVITLIALFTFAFFISSIIFIIGLFFSNQIVLGTFLSIVFLSIICYTVAFLYNQ